MSIETIFVHNQNNVLSYPLQAGHKLQTGSFDTFLSHLRLKLKCCHVHSTKENNFSKPRAYIFLIHPFDILLGLKPKCTWFFPSTYFGLLPSLFLEIISLFDILYILHTTWLTPSQGHGTNSV